MGYEIKLYIGQFSSTVGQFSKYDDKWYEAYKHKESDYVGYLADGNTEIQLDDPTYEARYLMEVASLDLCKPGHQSNIQKLMSKKSGKAAYGYFSRGGNEADIVDCYDEFLLAYPIEDVLMALEEDRNSDSYRRFKIACDLLISIKEEFKDAHVVLYGH